MNSHRKHAWPLGFAAAILFASACCLPGCGDAAAEPTDKPAGEIPAPGSLFVPPVEIVAVRGSDFIEHIELPGVSVMGMESTPLYAKVGGFVKEIRRVARSTIAGKTVQITDTMDRETYSVRDIEFRVVGASPKKSGNTVVKAASADELKAKWPKLYDAYQQADMMELDIGSTVEAGSLLAVLDIPEMADDLRKQQAAVERARQTVAQKVAAIASANAHVGQTDADYAKSQKARDEVAAKLAQHRKELDRIKRLGGNVEGAVLEQVEFKVAASQAALASAVQQIKSAAETVKVAKAAVDKAKADENVAKAQVKEAEAEIARLKTLADYANIRAPFTGTITRRFVDHRAFVKPAQGNSGAKPLFGFVRTDKVRVVIPVPGQKSFKVKTGQDAVLHTIGGLPGVTVNGSITRSAKTFDPASRMLRVEMSLSNPVKNSRLIREDRGWKPRAPSAKGDASQPAVVIRPGMFGVITVRKQWKQLRMLPATAIAGEGGDQYVLQVVDAGGGKLQVLKRFVTVVFNDAKSVGISDGIPVGAQVVASGVAGLKDGQTVMRKGE